MKKRWKKCSKILMRMMVVIIGKRIERAASPYILMMSLTSFIAPKLKT